MRWPLDPALDMLRVFRHQRDTANSRAPLGGEARALDRQILDQHHIITCGKRGAIAVAMGRGGRDIVNPGAGLIVQP